MLSNTQKVQMLKDNQSMGLEVKIATGEAVSGRGCMGAGNIPGCDHREIR